MVTMAPKKSLTDSDKTSEKQPKSLLLTSRGDVDIIAKLQPQVQDKWRIQRSVRNSLLGYATLDLLENGQRLVFGRWNSRPLKDTHIKRLVTSFEHDGLERFDENTVIPVVLKKDSIDSSALTHDLTEVDKLPPLIFSDSSNASTPILCAGGCHRFEALGLYIGQLRNKHKEVEKRRELIARISDEDLTDEDVHYYNVESVKELEHLGGILKYGGRWLVAVYDYTSLLADGIELAQYLSRNETKYVYMQTDEERVIMEIQYLATLSDSQREERLKQLRKSNASKKADPLIGIMNSEIAFKSTETLVNYSTHFLEMPQMNIRWLYNHLCGLHGGLMCAAIRCMAEKLELCLTDVPLDMKTVDTIIPPGEKALPRQKQLMEQQMRQIREGKVVKALISILPDVLNVIDEAWQQNMQKPASDAMGCMENRDYASAFSGYVSEAIDTLTQRLKEDDILSQVDKSFHLLVDSIPAKLKLVLLDYTSTSYGLPILTRSPLGLLPAHFCRIPLVLMEISRWLDPLVDYLVAFSKSSYARSATQAAIDAIGRYGCITKKCPAGDLLLHVVLNDYGACLYLETELAEYTGQHTQRIGSAKELAIILPPHKQAIDAQAKDDSDLGTTLRSKHRSKIPSQKETEQKARMASIRSHCNALVKAMMAACKPKNAIPLKHKSNLVHQGAYLLLHTSWDWEGILSNSRSREFQHIAGAAVLEFNIIAEYRDDLIQSVPAAAFLRGSIAKQLMPYMKTNSVFIVRNNTSGDMVEFVFPDQISMSSVKEEFEVSESLTWWIKYQDLQEDRQVVQKIVTMIEKNHLAWKDPFNKDKSKSPSLNSAIQEALEVLVKELAMNAFRKRSGDLNAEEEEEDPSDINLNIVFRGCEDHSLLPRGQRKKRLLPHISKKIRSTLNEGGDDLDSVDRAKDRPSEDRPSEDRPSTASQNESRPTEPPIQAPVIAEETPTTKAPAAKASVARAPAPAEIQGAAVPEETLTRRRSVRRNSSSSIIISNGSPKPKPKPKRVHQDSDDSNHGPRKRAKVIKFAQS